MVIVEPNNEVYYDYLPPLCDGSQSTSQHNSQRQSLNINYGESNRFCFIAKF